MAKRSKNDKSKPRFILIDPSFDGASGDKWQYAVTFAKSALRAGYEFVLLSAKSSPTICDTVQRVIGEPIEEHRIFDYTFYDHGKIVSRQSDTASRLAARRDSVTLRAALSEIEGRIDRAKGQGDLGLARYWERVKDAEVRAAARRAGARFKEEKVGAATFGPFNRDDFALAMADHFSKHPPRHGDRLFFHTITPGMLESFTELTMLLGLETPLDVDAYCLFHFGGDAPDARTFIDRYHSFSHMKSLGDRLRSGSPFRRLHFVATNRALADECEQMLSLPVRLFEGLTDCDAYFAANGGEHETEKTRRRVAQVVRDEGLFSVSIRAGDASPEVLAAIKNSALLVERFGIRIELRILYTIQTAQRLRAILVDAGDFPIRYIPVDDNDKYIQELTNTNLMVLSYERDRYVKRVSAVLHDCAVLGTSCLVPRGTTLADARDYASIYAYSDTDDIAGLILRAARDITGDDHALKLARREVARKRYASDVVNRLVLASPFPSLDVEKRGPIAVVVMPAWGRCGSSYAMEGQIRFLLRSGFFVVQLFVLDKASDIWEGTPFFWSILQQNSQYVRGSIQRLAFSDRSEVAALQDDDAYLSLGAFDQFQRRLSIAGFHDPQVSLFLKIASLTIVNHVFHTEFAFRHVGGPKVLETHDIQSYQMHTWPLINARDQRPDSLADLLKDELAAVARYDHVVNVAPEEHAMLSIANRQSTLVTPYLPADRLMDPGRFASVADMAAATGMDSSYQFVDRFDLLLIGDSHPANVEAGAWLLDQVFRPYLAPRGVRLAIVGRLSDALHDRYGGIGGVFYAGFVANLEAVRELSDVCLLPDQRGTGISIKTLEALEKGMPFVATSVALRGIADRLPPEVMTFEDPSAFAEEALRLLDDREARAISGALARRSYEAVASEQVFFRHWSEILATLQISPSQDAMASLVAPSTITEPIQPLPATQGVSPSPKQNLIREFVP